MESHKISEGTSFTVSLLSYPLSIGVGTEKEFKVCGFYFVLFSPSGPVVLTSCVKFNNS